MSQEPCIGVERLCSCSGGTSTTFASLRRLTTTCITHVPLNFANVVAPYFE